MKQYLVEGSPERIFAVLGSQEEVYKRVGAGAPVSCDAMERTNMRYNIN